MIATYLVHHGYCSTAEAFARSTGQEFGEEVASIKNRQSIEFRMTYSLFTNQYSFVWLRNPTFGTKWKNG